MSVISVKVHNFKKLESFEHTFNGKSFFVIGDSKEGKSTLLNVILSTLMIKDFPEDPITTGKESGFVEAVHEFEGMKYTIRRTFTNDKDKKTRFTVTDEKGVRHTLSNLLENLWGKAFTNAYFDYNQFFFQQKSTETRTAYLIKAIGGEDVNTNLDKIKKLKLQRAAVSNNVDQYQYIINNSTLNPETLEADIELYKEEKKNDVALEKKNEILAKRKSIVNLNTQLQIVREGNGAYEMSEISLSEKDFEIEELKKQLNAALEERTKILEWQRDNPGDLKRQGELELELSTAEEDNRKLEIEADEIYDTEMSAINKHNSMRAQLHEAIESYDLYLKYNKQWEEKDAEIKRLIKENKTIFTSRLPIPEMSIEEVDDKMIVMYNGREFSYENLSKGESLKLAMEIQRFLNPKGNNLIVIPEAQSIGSEDMAEILSICKDNDIQAIIEETQRKQKMQIKFEEDYI